MIYDEDQDTVYSPIIFWYFKVPYWIDVFRFQPPEDFINLPERKIRPDYPDEHEKYIRYLLTPNPLHYGQGDIYVFFL